MAPLYLICPCNIGCSGLAKGALRWSISVLFILHSFSLPERGQQLLFLQLFRCRIMRPRYDKRVSQSGLSYSCGVSCHRDAFNEHSLSCCTKSVTTSCIQQWLPLLLLVAAWQLTSDAPCSSWSLFNKLDPPISFQPSGLTLRLPAPLGWPWCHLHVGVPKAQVTEYIYQRPHPTLPHLNRPSSPLMRTGFIFFSNPVPSFNLLLTAPICLRGFIDREPWNRQMTSLHVLLFLPFFLYLSLPLSLSLSSKCGACVVGCY